MKDSLVWVQEFVQRYWSQGLPQRTPTVVTLAVIILLSQTMAELTWTLMPVPDAEDSAKSTQQRQRRTVPSSQRAKPVAQKIGQWNLFGKYEAVTAKPQVVQQVVVETKLNLKLLGVFASKNEENARAIIADAKSEEEAYAIGDDIPGGAVLAEIYPDHVVIEHNGQLETLKLPEDVLEGGGGVQPAIANRPSLTRQSIQSAAGGRSTGADFSNISSSAASDGAVLGQIRNAITNDPQSVMGLINGRPYNKEGRMVGYRIRPGKDRQLLDRFGLKSGDIVTAVNGVPLDNPIKALEILRDLSTASQITVDIERNGATQTLSHTIE